MRIEPGTSSGIALGVAVAMLIACGGAASEDTAVIEPAPAPGASAAPAPASTATPKPKPKPAPAPAPAPDSEDKGEIEVTTAAGVTCQIDGSNVMFDPVRGSFHKRLSPGSHTVEIYNALGKNVATEKVDVKSGQREKFRYKTGGRFESFGSFPLD